MQGIKTWDTALSTQTTDARTNWRTGGITEIDVISVRGTSTFRSELSFVRIVRQIQTTARAEKWRGRSAAAGATGWQIPAEFACSDQTLEGSSSLIYILQPPGTSQFRHLPATSQTGQEPRAARPLRPRHILTSPSRPPTPSHGPPRSHRKLSLPDYPLRHQERVQSGAENTPLQSHRY